MTNKVEFFTQLEDIRRMVRIQNGDKVSITGKNIVAIPIDSYTKQIFFYVFLVPDLVQNLMSVGQMMQKAYVLVFGDGLCTIKDANGEEFMSVPMQDRSFPLN
jgi:hypothetical protein